MNFQLSMENSKCSSLHVLRNEKRGDEMYAYKCLTYNSTTSNSNNNNIEKSVNSPPDNVVVEVKNKAITVTLLHSGITQCMKINNSQATKSRSLQNLLKRLFKKLLQAKAFSIISAGKPNHSKL